MADVSMKAAAPLGAAFTAIALFTGALWGRPTWGTFWEWDGRMTSTLILLLIYLGLIAMWRAFEHQARGPRLIAIVTLVGAINIPIIKFSVDWWNTLHQPASVFRADGPTMPPSILLPLFTMMFAFTFLFALLQIIRMRTEIDRRRADRQHFLAKPLYLRLIRRRHLHPDLAGAHIRQHFSHDSGRSRWAGQAGDHRITTLHECSGAFAITRSSCHLLRDELCIQIVRRHVVTVAQETARQLTTYISKADKSNFHNATFLVILNARKTALPTLSVLFATCA